MIALAAVAAIGIGAAIYLTRSAPAATVLAPPPPSPGAPPGAAQYTDGNSTGAVLNGIGNIFAGAAGLAGQLGLKFGS